MESQTPTSYVKVHHDWGCHVLSISSFRHLSIISHTNAGPIHIYVNNPSTRVISLFLVYEPFSSSLSLSLSLSPPSNKLTLRSSITQLEVHNFFLSTMSSNKKKVIPRNVTVNLGCGSCRRSKILLSNIFRPKPKYHKTTPTFRSHNPSYSSTSSWHTTTTTTFSPATAESSTYYSDDTDSDIRSLRAVQGFGRLGGESLAVEKESDDPYLDFRQSMLQMILENEIYSKDDLKELLNCFLQLNSPYHHGIIVRAFTDIWNGVFSVRPGSSKVRLHGVHKSRDF